MELVKIRRTVCRHVVLSVPVGESINHTVLLSVPGRGCRIECTQEAELNAIRPFGVLREALPENV